MGDMSEHIAWANPVGEYEEHIAGRCDKDCTYCAEDDEEYYGEENVK